MEIVIGLAILAFFQGYWLHPLKLFMHLFYR